MELIEQLEYFGLETERCNYFVSYGEIFQSSYAKKKGSIVKFFITFGHDEPYSIFTILE